MKTEAEGAYEISWSVAHLGDDATDADLVKFEGWEKTMGLISRDLPPLPSPVIFEANAATLRTSDFPSSDVSWPIVSRRMLKALCSAGEFAHRELFVAMIDDTIPTERRFDAQGKLLSGVADDGFVALQLLDPLDVIDWKLSVFDKSELAPGLDVTFFNKIVLRGNAAKFPPMFRVTDAPNRLFISEAAKKAFERSRLQGIELTPVAVTAVEPVP